MQTPQFGGFQPSGKVKIAQAMGFQGPMEQFDRFLEDNPDKLQVIIYNRYEKGSNYSGNIYDIGSATKDGVVYPSLDPSCFELKFPATDIEGRVVGSSSGGN